MPEASIHGVRIRGIAAAVPERVLGPEDLSETFGPEMAAKLVASTGVRQRRRVRPGQTTTDLAECAAKSLVRELAWEPSSIDVLLFVSQTFDYLMPASSCVLHGTLGLSKSAAAFDIGLGCSGWTYGVWLASSLIAGGCRRALLLAGDTNEHIAATDGLQALAGDAATATALEESEDGVIHTSVGTDGNRWRALWVPAGGSRSRSRPETRELHACEDGVERSDENTHMNGPDIFSFTIREVPPLLDRALAQTGWAKDDVDAFVLHQANKYIIDYLIKRVKLDPSKTPLSLDEFGNTSSASIPLTIHRRLGERLARGRVKLVAAGFGVGLSFGSVATEIDSLALPELQVLP